MKRVLVLAALFGVPLNAQASFELLLVSDSTNDCIHRFDGSTGTYLGKFGSLMLAQPTTLALDVSNNLVYVADLTRQRVFAFNYNTGAYVNDFAFIAGLAPYSMFVAHDGTIVIGNDLGSAYRVNSSGVLMNTYSRASSSAASVAQGQNNELFIAWDGPTDQIQRFTLGGALLGTSSVSSNSYSFIGGGRITGTVGLLPDWGSTSVFRYSADNSLAHLSSWAYSSFNSVRGVAFGHGNVMYVIGTTGAGSNVQVANATTGAGYGLFNELPSSSFTGLAVVVAPEPGALPAMLTGAILLSRRAIRRRIR